MEGFAKQLYEIFLEETLETFLHKCIFWRSSYFGEIRTGTEISEGIIGALSNGNPLEMKECMKKSIWKSLEELRKLMEGLPTNRFENL